MLCTKRSVAGQDAVVAARARLLAIEQELAAAKVSTVTGRVW